MTLTSRYPSVPLLTTVLLPLAAAFLMAGCKTATYNYDLEIDSVAATGQRWGPTYEIKPVPGSPADTDPYFGGVATIIGQEVQAKGLYPVPQGDQPDLIILVDYGMHPPTIEYKTIQVPAPMGTMGIDPITGRPIRNSGYGTSGSTGGQITYVEEVRAYTVIEKYMTLSAVQGKINPETGSRRELANVSVSSSDERQELEPYLPVLAMATGRQLGAPTSGSEEVTVKADR